MRRLKLLFAAIMMACLGDMAQTQENKIKAVKVEFDGSSMTFGLSHHPEIVMQDGQVVIKTILQSITLPLPCKATFVDANGTAIEDAEVYNNDITKPLYVYSLDGKKVATLKDKDGPITLRRGIYIINGKKIMIK